MTIEKRRLSERFFSHRPLPNIFEIQWPHNTYHITHLNNLGNKVPWNAYQYYVWKFRSQFFRTTTGIKLESVILGQLRTVLCYAIIFWVTEMLHFIRVLKRISSTNYCTVNRAGATDLSFLRTLFAIHQNSLKWNQKSNQVR